MKVTLRLPGGGVGRRLARYVEWCESAKKDSDVEDSVASSLIGS